MAAPEHIGTEQELKDYILRKLGGCNVAVELSPSQLGDAIQDALDQFNTYMCKPVPNVLKNQTGSVRIPLGENVRGVIYVKALFPEITRVYEQVSIWEMMYRMMFPRLPLGAWVEMRMFYKMFQQVRGTDPDWDLDESTNTLYVDCKSGPYDVFYVTSEDLTVENMATIKKAYTRLFRKLAVGEAKLTLARVRGKYGNSIPVPGGTLTTDAAELQTQGELAIAEVEVKLEQMARFTQSPVMWG